MERQVVLVEKTIYKIEKLPATHIEEGKFYAE